MTKTNEQSIDELLRLLRQVTVGTGPYDPGITILPADVRRLLNEIDRLRAEVTEVIETRASEIRKRSAEARAEAFEEARELLYANTFEGAAVAIRKKAEEERKKAAGGM